LVLAEVDWVRAARDAAVAIAMSGTPGERGAEQYAVSSRMMSWRVNATGARAQAARCAKS
jgi:hypothetical protein